MCFRLCIVLYFTLYSVCIYIYKADFSHVNKNRSWAARPTQDKREPENYQQKKKGTVHRLFPSSFYFFFFSSACNHNITRVLLHSFFFFFSWPESGDSVTFPRVNLFLLTLFFLVILFHFEGG